MAEIEEIFERGTEEIDDHRIVVALGSEPAHEGDADATGKGLVHLRLVLELRVLGLDGLKFDSDLFSRYYVDTEVDVTCNVDKA